MWALLWAICGGRARGGVLEGEGGLRVHCETDENPMAFKGSDLIDRETYSYINLSHWRSTGPYIRVLSGAS